MLRPNKKDYLTTNQREYDFYINQYYKNLEKYIDYLEKESIEKQINLLLAYEVMLYNSGDLSEKINDEDRRDFLILYNKHHEQRMP